MAQGERTNPLVVSFDFIESLDRVGPVEPPAGEIIGRPLELKVLLEQSPGSLAGEVPTPEEAA